MSKNKKETKQEKNQRLYGQPPTSNSYNNNDDDGGLGLTVWVAELRLYMNQSREPYILFNPKGEALGHYQYVECVGFVHCPLDYDDIAWLNKHNLPIAHNHGLPSINIQLQPQQVLKEEEEDTTNSDFENLLNTTNMEVVEEENQQTEEALPTINNEQQQHDVQVVEDIFVSMNINESIKTTDTTPPPTTIIIPPTNSNVEVSKPPMFKPILPITDSNVEVSKPPMFKPILPITDRNVEVSKPPMFKPILPITDRNVEVSIQPPMFKPILPITNRNVETSIQPPMKPIIKPPPSSPISSDKLNDNDMIVDSRPPLPLVHKTHKKRRITEEYDDCEEEDDDDITTTTTKKKRNLKEEFIHRYEFIDNSTRVIVNDRLVFNMWKEKNMTRLPKTLKLWGNSLKGIGKTYIYGMILAKLDFERYYTGAEIEQICKDVKNNTGCSARKTLSNFLKYTRGDAGTILEKSIQVNDVADISSIVEDNIQSDEFRYRIFPELVPYLNEFFPSS